MIERSVFYTRKAICEACQWWRNVCLKGHPLASPVGCPIRKFEPIDAAGYHPDSEVVLPEPGGQTGCCGKQTEMDLKPLTWAEAFVSFKDSMQRANEAGWPLRDDKAYVACVRQCKKNECGHYYFWQCKFCKCVILAKAKLATEDCPKGLWPQP